MKLDLDDIKKMIDVSLLRSDVTVEEIKKFIEEIKKYRFMGCFVMPCYTKMLINAFKNDKDILVGGVVGFPTGADTTECKVKQVEEFINMGSGELDMVINIGYLKSGLYKEAEKDIKSVARASRGYLLKVILEVSLLTDNEIKKGCEIVANSGAEFVKTGTGWTKVPTSLHHIEVIKEAICNKIKIKAAGGINSLNTFLEMYKLGVSRFGIGLNSAINILKEAENKLANSGYII